MKQTDMEDPRISVLQKQGIPAKDDRVIDLKVKEVEKIANKINRCFSELGRNLDVDVFMRDIYECVDRLLSPLKKTASCKKGCSYCCHMPVDITLLEAQYINTQTNTPINHARADANKNDPCPFLKNNRCSIYKFRPLSCRSYFTFDSPMKCKNNEERVMVTAASNKGIFNVLVEFYKISDRVSGDIREFFGPVIVN